MDWLFNLINQILAPLRDLTRSVFRLQAAKAGAARDVAQLKQATGVGQKPPPRPPGR